MPGSTIDSRELVQNLLPKLSAAEDIVSNTLLTLVEQAESDSVSQLRRTQKEEFELEITMIRMNLDHLLKRYAVEIEACLNQALHQPLELDEHEAFAIKSAYALYDRVRDYQQV